MADVYEYHSEVLSAGDCASDSGNVQYTGRSTKHNRSSDANDEGANFGFG